MSCGRVYLLLHRDFQLLKMVCVICIIIVANLQGWNLPGIYALLWQDSTSPTTGKSRTVGRFQLIDVHGYLFNGYCSDFCTMYPCIKSFF